MPENLILKAQELQKNNEPFATATVVWREAPSSAKTGDKAIINKFGDLIGWVGGGCVKGIIIKEAEDAMKSGKARLVKISPAGSSEKQEGIMEYKMTCMSEGSVDVFIEPNLPPPHLVVIGKSAIAKALVKMAKTAGYRVTAVAPDATPATFEKVDELFTQLNLQQVKIHAATSILVATQGEQDEAALEMALQQQCAYIGFVASRKKKASVFEYLSQHGIDKNLLARVMSPAGLDINAKKPEEVAISILAEIIQVQNSAAIGIGFTRYEEAFGSSGSSAKFYINPVCGIPIDTANPKHIVDYNGEKVYFCCDGCKVKFDAEPEKYMKKAMLQ